MWFVSVLLVKLLVTSTWDWIILSFNAIGIVLILIMMGLIQGRRWITFDKLLYLVGVAYVCQEGHISKWQKIDVPTHFHFLNFNLICLTGGTDELKEICIIYDLITVYFHSFSDRKEKKPFHSYFNRPKCIFKRSYRCRRSTGRARPRKCCASVRARKSFTSGSRRGWFRVFGALFTTDVSYSSPDRLYSNFILAFMASK